MRNLYVLIMAGGGGTRLWPLSRKQRPKQMLPLLSERSMFQMAVDRLAPILSPERIFVVAGRDYLAPLHASVPHVPRDNFIGEPYGRNTAPAVALGLAHILARDPDAVIAVLTADHYIADSAQFCRVLTAGAQLAAQDYIVTLGISPSYPATGFGYIRRGAALETIGEFETFYSEGFTEKPDAETALQFVASGLYSWNSGMFIFSGQQMVAEFQRQQPDMAAALSQLRASAGGDDYPARLEALWPSMAKLSIDYAIMEGAERVAVIPVDVGWDDVGSWDALLDVLQGDESGNVVKGRASADHIALDTHQSLVISDRLVVTIGLDGVVVVDTDDVLLVCHREHAQAVRTAVNQLREQGRDDVL